MFVFDLCRLKGSKKNRCSIENHVEEGDADSLSKARGVDVRLLIVGKGILASDIISCVRC